MSTLRRVFDFRNRSSEGASGRYAGCFDEVRDGHAVGWAVDRKDPDRIVTVQLRVDGKAVASAPADRPRPDVQAAGFGQGLGGFALRIPEAFADGKPHQIGVTFATGDEWVQGGPKPYEADAPAPETPEPDAEAAPARSYDGFFEGVTDGAATGWACDLDNPRERVQLELRIDGQAALIVTADEPRADVSAAGRGDGFNGFLGRLPARVYDGKPHQVSVAVAGSRFVLPGGPYTVTQKRSGMVYLDRAATAIGGWATQGSDVVIRFDEREAVTVSPRRNVPGFGGERVAQAACGFLVDIPSAFLDGAWHSASVRFAGGGEDLPGSPFEFRLRTPPVRLGLTRSGGTAIEGWAVDPLRPGTPVRLFVFVDRAFYGDVTASKRRGEGADAPGRRADGFSFTLPRGAGRLDFATSRDPATVFASFDIGADRQAAVAEPDDDAYQGATRFADAAFAASVREAFDAFLAEPGRRFDADWYLRSHPAAARGLAAGADRAAAALAHYRAHGVRDGLSPSPLFDEAWYRRRWPSVGRAVEAGIIPSGFAHYLAAGARAGFDPIPGFSARDYLDANPAAAEEVRDGLAADFLESWLRQVYAGTAAGWQPEPLPEGRPPRAPRPPGVALPALSKGIYAAWIGRLVADTEGGEQAGRLAELTASDRAATRAYLETALPAEPLVSIIMPTYNRAYTIAEAIQSVLDQTYENWELLVCDDGSIDKTPLVIAQIDDPRIRYMHFEKTNGAATRNKGLSFAQGEYIAYLDSDNIWHPLYLDVMLRTLLVSPSRPCAYCGYIDTELVGTRIDLQALAASPFNPVKFTERNFIDLNTICHHRKLYDWLGGFDNALPRVQDWDLTLRYFSVFHPVLVPQYLAFYRRNVAWGQVTSQFFDQDINAIVTRKTEERLTKGHVRLDIDWPAHPRLAVIVGSGPDAMFVAEGLMHRVVGGAEVTLIHAGRGRAPRPLHPGDGIVELPLGEEAFETPHTLAAALQPFLSRETALVGIGLSEAMVEGLRHRLAVPLDTLVVAGNGLGLAGAGSGLPFHVGTLPLPRRKAPPPPDAPRQTVLLLSPQGRPAPGTGTVQGWIEKVAEKLPAKDFDVILAPSDLTAGTWHFVGGEEAQAETWSERGLAALERALASAQAVGCTVPAEELGVAMFTVVTEAMARGLVLMLPPSAFSEPLVEARAAYNVSVREGAWLLDKARRLTPSNADADRFARNAARVHRIVHNTELVEERLRFYLHERCFEGVR